MISQIPFAQAKQQQDKGEIQVIVAESPALQVFLMAVDIEPFDDPLVRQAFRLIPDRQALIDSALFGFGSVGNDLAGKGLPFYAEDLAPREQDLEQAAALLRQAGKENLEVTLHTSDIVPGFVEAATLFAQQAQGAGVKVEVKREPANAYFDKSLLYTKLDFAQSFGPTRPSRCGTSRPLLSDAVWNETHWRHPETTSRFLRGAGRSRRGDRDGPLAPDPGDSVRGGRLHRLGLPEPRRRRRPERAGVVPSSFFNLGLELPRRLPDVCSARVGYLDPAGDVTDLAAPRTAAHLPAAAAAPLRPAPPCGGHRDALRGLDSDLHRYRGAPGDAASAVLGRTASPEQLAEMRAAMGLDQPAYERYLDWLGGLLTGDLGNSAAGYAAGGESPIWDEIRPKIVNSFVLAGVTALLMIPLALVFGVLSAVRAGRPLDHTVTVSSLAIISLPEFIIGSLLILVFFSWLDVLPPVSLIPPGTNPLAEPDAPRPPGPDAAGRLPRRRRSGWCGRDARGPERRVRDDGPPERLLGENGGTPLRASQRPRAERPGARQNVQYLVGGIVVTEYLFNYPGLGKELVDAVAIRDVREVQVVALLIAAFYILINIVADLLVVLLVPS